MIKRNLILRISIILQLSYTVICSENITSRNIGDPITEWFDASEQIYGEGTYYGSASHIFMPTQYEGKIDARVALNDLQHRMGAYGMCIKVKGSGQGQGGQGSTPITTERLVYVADVCPECAWGDIDFAIPSDGRWQIDWHAVECPVDDNGLHYIFKGSHQYYLKILPQLFKCPIDKLEIFHHNEWISGEIANDNTRSYVFQALESHTYSFPMHIRVTSIFGEEILDEIPYIANEDTVIPGTRQAQFERCSFENHHHIAGSGTTHPTTSPFPTPIPTTRPTSYTFPSPSPTRQNSMYTYSPTKASTKSEGSPEYTIYTVAPSTRQQTPYPTHKKPVYTMEPTRLHSLPVTKTPTKENLWTERPTQEPYIYTSSPSTTNYPRPSPDTSRTPNPTYSHSDDEDEHSSSDIYESISG